MRFGESHSIRNVAPEPHVELQIYIQAKSQSKVLQSYPKKSGEKPKDTWHRAPEP
jgi:hypothetical protein